MPNLQIFRSGKATSSNKQTYRDHETWNIKTALLPCAWVKAKRLLSSMNIIPSEQQIIFLPLGSVHAWSRRFKIKACLLKILKKNGPFQHEHKGSWKCLAFEPDSPFDKSYVASYRLLPALNNWSAFVVFPSTHNQIFTSFDTLMYRLTTAMGWKSPPIDDDDLLCILSVTLYKQIELQVIELTWNYLFV